MEKAHPDIFNVLLQVLDDGHITDAQGRKIDFKNTVIIMTSNAGASNIVTPKKLGFIAADNAQEDYRRMKDGVMDEVKRIFKPEFLNRIDDIIVFHPLSREDIRQIVKIMLDEIFARARDQMNITLSASRAVLDHLADIGFDPNYGARPLRRAIQNEIEDAMAEAILDNNIKSGDTVQLSIKKGKIDFASSVG